MLEKIMDLIGKDQLLEGDALGPQSLGQIHALSKGDVAVVVSVDQQHGRPPGLDRGHRRGLEREARQVLALLGLVGRLEVRDDPVPVVDSVEVHAGSEEARRAREPECRQVTAVRPAPQADPVRGDIRAAAQIEPGAFDVLKFEAPEAP